MAPHPDLLHLSRAVPDWVLQALNVARTEGHVEVDGCAIHYFTWGDAADPPLLFLHGRMSHARCWGFVAPLLSHRFFCVAFDLSGMGDSGHRDHYSCATRAGEAAAVLKAAEATSAAMIVSHSYGAVVGVNAVRATPGHYRGFVACDPSFAHPDLWAEQQPRVDGPELSRPGRVYPDLQTALSRFKLAPPQESVEPALEEYIAIHSVRPVQGGWSWKFDPYVYSSHEEGHNDWWVSHSQDFVELDLPKAIIYGRDSAMLDGAAAHAVAARSKDPVPVVGIPNAHHHIMADQPLALAASIEAIVDGLDQRDRLQRPLISA